jgi:carbon-monoxide dehydrogenase medium subunit
MRGFELIQPTTLEEASVALVEHVDSRVIAGGTALLTLIKHGLFVPKTLINLKHIKSANEIGYDREKGLRIGALAAIYDVESSPLVRQNYLVLAEASHVVANIRIRNMATIGGNIAHGDYQSDPPTVLVALDASVELLSRSQTRYVNLSEFLRGSYETALTPGELVSALVVPPADDWHGKYIKFTTGSSEERPCAGVAAIVRMIDEICVDLRLVVGAISPCPVRVHKAEEIARGEKLTNALLEQISAEARNAVDPIDDLRGTANYKRHLVGVLARRAVTAAAQNG